MEQPSHHKDVKARLNHINLPSYIMTQTVPITFHGLLNIINYSWLTMESSPFRKFYDNDEYSSSEDEYVYNRFQKENALKSIKKVMMHIAMAKLQYAQSKFQTSTIVQDTQSASCYYDERQLLQLPKRLPKPFAMYIDAIGKFTLQGQTIVPRLTKHKNTFEFNVAPNSMDEWLLAHATPVVEDEDFLYTKERLKEFNFKWEKVNEGWRLSPEDVTFYSGFPTCEQIMNFNCALSQLNESFLVRCDITTGVGSLVQAVRIPARGGYYILRSIPDKEVAMANMFQLGEDAEDKASPLVGDDMNSYKRGGYSLAGCYVIVNKIIDSYKNIFVDLKDNTST